MPANLREKAGKQNGQYHDRKYVRVAGNTAYNGILVALDSLLEEKKKGRKDPGPQRRTVPGGDVV